MALAKSKKRVTRRVVNMSQPSEILKQKQKARILALLAEQRRQNEMRRQFESFLASQVINNNINWRNWNSNNATRRRRRR